MAPTADGDEELIGANHVGRPLSLNIIIIHSHTILDTLAVLSNLYLALRALHKIDLQLN